MAKKILILVLSYNAPPFDSLMRAQMETWNSVHHDDVQTIFYHGSNDDFIPVLKEDGRLILPCNDAYYQMQWKMKLALDCVWGMNWDLIFRTNSSSYVHKRRLIGYADSLPTEKLYGGWEIKTNPGTEFNIVSGAGIFLSRDTAEILKNELPEGEAAEEDYLAGQILNGNHKIPILCDKSRYDVGQYVGDPPKDRYHYRLKNGDRMNDVKNFFKLHEKVK